MPYAAGALAGAAYGASLVAWRCFGVGVGRASCKAKAMSA